MADNEIGKIRRNSTFANYVPQTEEQKNALFIMRGLAKNLVKLNDDFADGCNPFSDGNFFVLSGRPGVGKTQLVEAFVNNVKRSAPNVAESIFLFRGNITHECISSMAPTKFTFGSKPIVIIDDAYSTYQSCKELRPDSDVKILAGLISYLYDNRTLCLMTTNFPFIDDILPAIADFDKVGRTLSRCREMLTARAGELKLDGPDYREILAEQAVRGRKSTGSLFARLSKVTPQPK